LRRSRSIEQASENGAQAPFLFRRMPVLKAIDDPAPRRRWSLNKLWHHWVFKPAGHARRTLFYLAQLTDNINFALKSS
jgi:hypothetical protein